MKNEHLTKLIRDYVSENNPKNGFQYTYFGNLIIPNKLTYAKQSFARFDVNSEFPIMLFDNSLTGNASEGILVTNLNLYYKMPEKWSSSSKNEVIPLCEINQFSLEIKTFGSKFILNNKQFGYTSLLNTLLRKEATVIDEAVNIIIHNLNEGDSKNLLEEQQFDKPQGRDSIIKAIKDLKSLMDYGIISEEEFMKKKEELLRKI